MDIRLNNFRSTGPTSGAIQADAANSAAAAKAAKGATRDGFSVTELTAGPEDIAAAVIPESALTRDDPLGRLVSQAFNLPAPPMPFTAS